MRLEDSCWRLGEYPKPAWPLGGKGEGLYRIWSSGLPVPATLVISSEAAEKLADGIGIDYLVEQVRNACGDGPVIVRSSADVEDGESDSYAGIFESVAGVQVNGPELAQAARRVLASYSAISRHAYEGGSTRGHFRNGDRGDRATSGPLLIQPYLTAQVGGVLFTKVTFEDGRCGALIEVAAGGRTMSLRGSQPPGSSASATASTSSTSGPRSRSGCRR